MRRAEANAMNARKNAVHFWSTPEANLARFSPIEANQDRTRSQVLSHYNSAICKTNLEARVGIEPTHKGFADLSLTTWVPRLIGTLLEILLPLRGLRISPGGSDAAKTAQLGYRART